MNTNVSEISSSGNKIVQVNSFPQHGLGVQSVPRKTVDTVSDSALKGLTFDLRWTTSILVGCNFLSALYKKKTWKYTWIADKDIEMWQLFVRCGSQLKQ